MTFVNTKNNSPCYPQESIYLAEGCDYLHSWTQVTSTTNNLPIPFPYNTEASFVIGINYGGKNYIKLDIACTIDWDAGQIDLHITPDQITNFITAGTYYCTDTVYIGRWDIVIIENGIKSVLFGGDLFIQRSFER